MAKVFMKPDQTLRAISYIQQNAQRLLQERPHDEELAQELTQELGEFFSTSNARTLRRRYNIPATIVRDGEMTNVIVTWKPTYRGIKHGGPSYLKNNMQLSAAIRQLEKRVLKIEETLRELGATL